MKKIGVCIIATFVLLTLYGCGSDEEKEEKKEFYALNETINIEDSTLTVNGVTKSSGSEFNKSKEGMEFVIVEVTITNTGEESLSYNSLYFKMQNSQGQIGNQTFSIVNADTALNSGELTAGGNVTGTIIFEQPINDSDLTLIYSPGLLSNDEIKIKLQ